MVNKLKQALATCQDPSVHDVGVARLHSRIPLVIDALNLLQKSDLALKELVTVPQRQQDLLNNFLDTRLLESKRLGSDDWGADEIQSQSVGSILVHDDRGIGEVLESLGHLLSVFGEDDSVDNAVLERRAAEKVGTENEQGVEPSSSLIETLGDEVSGERLLELFDILKGVVLTGVGHAARLEPTIEHLLNTLQCALAHLARNSDVINLVSMQIGQVAGVPTQLAEFLNATNTDSLLEIITDPERHGSTPVSVSAHVPITSIGDPASKTTILDRVWHPVRSLNVLEHVGNDLGDANEPRRNSSVDERSVRARTHGVRMPKLRIDNDAAGTLEVLDNVLVGFLDVHASKVADTFGEVTSIVDGIGRRTLLSNDSGFNGRIVIVLSESGSLMDETNTTIGSNVRSVDDLESNLLEILVEVVEQGLVLPSQHVLARESLHNLEFSLLGVLVKRAEQLLEKNEVLSGLLVGDLDVLEFGVGGQGQVRWEGPGSSCPGEQACVGVGQKGEGNNNCRVNNVLVVLVGLEVAQGGGEGGRVRHDTVSLVNGALVEQLLENPPF